MVLLHSYQFYAVFMPRHGANVEDIYINNDKCTVNGSKTLSTNKSVLIRIINSCTMELLFVKCAVKNLVP